VLIRRAFALALGALLPLAVSTPVRADDRVIGTAARDAGLVLVNGAGGTAPADLLSLRIADQVVRVYCIDFAHEMPSGAGYLESSWRDAQVPNLGKIQWILWHGYPNVPAATLIASVGGSTAPIAGEDIERVAYAGTQAAIWSLSDPGRFALGAYMAGQAGLPTEAEYDLVSKIYEYLRGAVPAQLENEPAPPLKIEPPIQAGMAGELIGPYTVISGGGAVNLTAHGGEIVDQDGHPIGAVPSGGRFWVLSDDSGHVSVSATGLGEVQVGRVFLHANGQKLILATDARTALSVTATATFTAKPSGLPVTGASVTGAVVAGVLLLAAGGLLVSAMRRRRIRFTV
jgi:TQXA domain-containing protein/LPXTG-motif cell wall-anchored protein